MANSVSAIRHGNDVGPYLREIQQAELLSPAEEQELALEIRQGNEDARQRMIQSNLRLVIKIASEFLGRGLPFEDLISEGNIGLIRATQEYDPSFGTRFSTYASYWVKQAIHHALINTGSTIRLPAHIVGLLVRWKRTEQKLLRRLGRRPSFDEISEDLEIGEPQRHMVAQAIRALQMCREGAAGDSDQGNWLPEDAADPNDGPEQPIDKNDEIQNLRRRLLRLDDRERTVLALRFGLGGVPPHTIKQVAETLGVTREWVRRLEIRALEQLAADQGETVPRGPHRRPW